MLLNLIIKKLKVVEKVLRTQGRTLTNGKINGNVVSSGFPDVRLPRHTLPEFFAPYFEKFENFVAVECSTTKRKYTYREIDRKSKNLAKALRKFWNLQDGDVVAVILSNVPEYPITNMGILRANLTITTVSSLFTSDEIGNQLIDANVKFVITEVDLVTKVNESLRKVSKIMPVMTLKTRNGQYLPHNTIDFHELVNTEIDYPDVTPWNPENVAAILYSSGTTGLPKGVQLTHNNLVANIFQHSQTEVRFLCEASEKFQEVLPTTLPLYHAMAYNLVMNGLVIYGGKMVTLEKYSPKSYISMLKEYHTSTILCSVPPIVLMLTGNEDVKKEYLRNIRLVICGAAPLGFSDELRFLDKFGDHITLTQGYGMTESTCVATFSYPNLKKSIKGSTQGSVGIPTINTSLKIVGIEDPEEKPLGPKKTGQIFIRGPQVMKGYLNRIEDTKLCITEDGWLRSGDVGYYDDEGLFFITDRLKELIKVKAYQVAPVELEGVIRSFPGVLEAAVIGIPHASCGEVPRAYVVPKFGHTVDAAKLREFVSAKVAAYKELKGGVAIVEEIPKSASGKILRRKLKEEFFRSAR